MATPSEYLIKVVKAGGSIKVSIKSYLIQDLVDIAKELTPNAKLILTECEKKLPSNLTSIAQAAPGKVIFEFND